MMIWRGSQARLLARWDKSMEPGIKESTSWYAKTFRTWNWKLELVYLIKLIFVYKHSRLVPKHEASHRRCSLHYCQCKKTKENNYRYLLSLLIFGIEARNYMPPGMRVKSIYVFKLKIASSLMSFNMNFQIA